MFYWLAQLGCALVSRGPSIDDGCCSIQDMHNSDTLVACQSLGLDSRQSMPRNGQLIRQGHVCNTAFPNPCWMPTWHAPPCGQTKREHAMWRIWNHQTRPCKRFTWIVLHAVGWHNFAAHSRGPTIDDRCCIRHLPIHWI